MATTFFSSMRRESEARTDELRPQPLVPLGRVDALWLALLAVVLVGLSLIQSRHKMFWGDEIMGIYVLRAENLHRFWELWCNGIDSSGIWFYILAKPWEWIVGGSEVKLRLFSTAGLFVSGVFIWLAARRFYAASVVAAGVFIPFCDLYVFRWQLANGRCYGIFMAASALVIYLMVRGSDEAHRMVRPRFLLATFVAYDVLAGSHILGMLYAGSFLVIQIATDLWSGKRRWSVYASAAVGIATVVLVSLKNIRSTTALGKPVFWTVRPDLRTIIFNNPRVLGLVAALVGALFLLVFLYMRRQPARDLIYILLLGMFVLHALFVLISRFSTSIYDTRYLLPLSFGLVLAIAELLTQMREAKGISLVRYALVLAALWAVAVVWAPRRSEFGLPYPNYTNELLADLPAGLPVIDTEIGSFVEEEFYHHGHFGKPFVYPIDQDVTNDITNPGGVSGFHEMDNFYRLHINAPDLQPTEKILATYREFAVITAAKPNLWFPLRIQGTNQYDVTDLGVHRYDDEYFRIWRVRKH